MHLRSLKLASVALAAWLMGPGLQPADAAALGPHGAAKAASKGGSERGLGSGSGILLVQGRGRGGGGGFRGGGGGFRGGGGGGFRGGGGGGFRGGGYRGGRVGGYRGYGRPGLPAYRGAGLGYRGGRVGYRPGIGRVRPGYYRGGWRSGRYWRGGRWIGPRYRYRRPGFAYFYGGWWYPYAWWGAATYAAPVTVAPAGQCGYWHAQCVQNWGANNPDYDGCMRFHGCN